MKRWRDWLELIRLPNVFTAIADPLAGALFAGATGWDSLGIVAVMLASAFLYTGGIVLNDWNDFKKDLKERPERPLPSRRIRRIHALLLAIGLLGAGAVVSMAAGTSANQVAILLMLAVLTYDILLKNTPIAPAVMGICRALNLLLGMLVVGNPVPGRLRFYAVLAMWLYITGVTVFARRETVPGRQRNLPWGAGGIVVAVLGLTMIPFLFRTQAPQHLGMVWASLLLAGTVYRITHALMTPKPESVQLAVKTCVLGVILFDAALVGYTRNFALSLPVVLLLVPAIWSGKRLYST